MAASRWLSALLLIVVSTGEMDDFDTVVDGYEFVYHDSHDLLLVLRGDVCYFVTIPEDSGQEVRLTNTTLDFKRQVILVIERHRLNFVSPSDLDHINDQFGDALASFRCLNKTIFTVTLPSFNVHHE